MKTIVVFLLGALLLAACQRGPGIGDRICTAEYRFFNVKLLTASGEAVTLDTFYTRIVATNTSFHASSPMLGTDAGRYGVISDDQLLLLKEGKNTELRFIGIKNEKALVNEPYVFKNNGCHIEKISGKNEVVVEDK
ncbi:hypothetical protein LL912_20720 [Niabella sp. CC-SYL272]|uniref:hypothetical protein n=1 Tax=Niabella agricola TaxID=2891571 RepID=UPI001F351EA2|nr:hypothetical protein [Niabella agricola]MCF3111224.1 hypothetical protein [Niabella agricola]